MVLYYLPYVFAFYHCTFGACVKDTDFSIREGCDEVCRFVIDIHEQNEPSHEHFYLEALIHATELFLYADRG